MPETQDKESIMTLSSLTHGLFARFVRSTRFAALLLGLAAPAFSGTVFADNGNYRPDTGSVRDYPVRDYPSRDQRSLDNGLDDRTVPGHRNLRTRGDDYDTLPPHRGGASRSNYRRADGLAPRDRFESTRDRFDVVVPVPAEYGDDRGGYSRPRFDEFDRNERLDRNDGIVPRDRMPARSPLYEDLPAPSYSVPALPGLGGSRYSPSRIDNRFDNTPFDNSWGPNLQDQLPRLAPRKPKQDPAPTAGELITRRYNDPAVVTFISQLNAQQGLQMYAEVLDLIQTRHLEPSQPSVLVQRGMTNLVAALQSPQFAQSTRIAVNPQQVAVFQQSLSAMLAQSQITTNQQAVAAAQWTMQAAQQTVGLAPSVVAVEFLYGAVESLDRFSAFVPPETARMTNQQLGEAVVGIGVQIEVAPNAGMKVVKVLPAGPALQSGLQKGDVIVAVNNQPLAGRSLDAATQLITGAEGTSAVLTVQRNGMQANFTIQRRKVQVQSVTDVQFVDASSKIGYLKLDTFAANSAKEMEAALWQLHQQGMQGLVLDLRGDPGGLLTTSIETADMFLPSGTIVSTRGRNTQDNSTEVAKEDKTWKVPMVVLIDEHSASASEIFAAAIQENGRGLIVGRHSYGKGTVQTLFPLNTLSAGVRLTTARFYSPSGKPMAGEGVEPDVYVAQSETDLGANDQDVRTAVEALRRGTQPSNPQRFDLSQR
jgi:carboxyl-terminal processing protease